MNASAPEQLGKYPSLEQALESLGIEGFLSMVVRGVDSREKRETILARPSPRCAAETAAPTLAAIPKPAPYDVDDALDEI